mmetsp:Transcript_30805/g.71986  ORF Transcript_30805/g.71986 Transcript_30805/m.71986 type:complete len:218 (-) Transcript_30805:298-951(-)
MSQKPKMACTILPATFTSSPLSLSEVRMILAPASPSPICRRAPSWTRACSTCTTSSTLVDFSSSLVVIGFIGSLRMLWIMSIRPSIGTTTSLRTLLDMSHVMLPRTTMTDVVKTMLPIRSLCAASSSARCITQLLPSAKSRLKVSTAGGEALKSLMRVSSPNILVPSTSRKSSSLPIFSFCSLNSDRYSLHSSASGSRPTPSKMAAMLRMSPLTCVA